MEVYTLGKGGAAGGDSVTSASTSLADPGSSLLWLRESGFKVLG